MKFHSHEILTSFQYVKDLSGGCIGSICLYFNPFLTNGFSHHYHLGEPTFVFKGIRSEFQLSYNFFMKILLANRIATDGTPRSAASHLGLFCLPMSHKRDARLK